MNAYVAEVGGVPEEVPFELVVFERTAGTVKVLVRGMTLTATVELVCFEAARRTSISVVGTGPRKHVRPYELCETVEIVPGQTIAVHGLGIVHGVPGSSLPEGVPVVWGADPLLAGLSGDFLHQRGDRYVMMTAAPAGADKSADRVA